MKEETPKQAPETADTEPVGTQPKMITGGKKKHKALWFTLLALIVIAGYGALGWLLYQANDAKSKYESEKSSQQKQIDDLKKQLEEAKKSSSKPSNSSAQTTPQKTAVSANTKENIAAAISSKNTAALEGYMAGSVNVVFAASEKAGPRTPTQAISDLEYLNSNATAPWNFSLDNATLTSYQNGYYKTYFPSDAYVGKSANNMVVSFNFDNNAKISAIFVSGDAELLK